MQKNLEKQNKVRILQYNKKDKELLKPNLCKETKHTEQMNY